MPELDQSLEKLLARVAGLDPGGHMSADEIRGVVRRHYAPQAMTTRFWDAMSEGTHTKAGRALIGTGVGSPLKGMAATGAIGMKGALSAILPIEPYEYVPGQAEGLTKYLPDWLAKSGGKVARTGFRWMGPVITAWRIKEEGISNTPKIVAQEMARTGMFMAGMKIGGAVGTAALGPGVGTVAGMAGGMLFAMAADPLVEMAGYAITGGPVTRTAAAGYRFIRDLGVRERKMELGGSLSAANRSMAAQTMRQRSLSQMSRSGINTRSLLGRESQLNHLR